MNNNNSLTNSKNRDELLEELISSIEEVKQRLDRINSKLDKVAKKSVSLEVRSLQDNMERI